MERSVTSQLRVGDWCFHPKSGEISRGGESLRLEERTARLLACLAERAGEVVSIDELLERVWPGVAVSSDSVYQAVATLRRQLQDNPKRPAYIETIPRLGYRLLARVSPWEPTPTAPEAQPQRRLRLLGILSALPLLALATAFLIHRNHIPSNYRIEPPRSVAVLPFLDLTDAMNEEPFADGMTEELIDKFSKIKGLQVPSPTASFYFKNKQLPLSEIAHALGVTYVVDGSVRKAGARLRVATRLVRAANGYVIWSETYDRPLNDVLKVQDEIAADVTKALAKSIETHP